MSLILKAIPEWAQLALLIATTISAMSAALGLFLTFNQSRRTNTQARATLVANCLKGFTEDEEIQRAFYTLEYAKFKYNKRFHNSQLERRIDKLLRHFANIALAWQANLLSIRDIRPIQYYVLRILRNKELQKYLEFIESWTRQDNLGEHPYKVLIKLAAALEQKRKWKIIGMVLFYPRNKRGRFCFLCVFPGGIALHYLTQITLGQ
ncbi:MAG: hypothetical protein ABSC54_02780 [Smithellaceae bacterium]|jgi:hypothetical protein